MKEKEREREDGEKESKDILNKADRSRSLIESGNSPVFASIFRLQRGYLIKKYIIIYRSLKIA